MLKTIIPGLYTFSGMIAGRVYLIEDANGGGCSIVDASIPPSGASILKQIRASGRQLSDVKRILITHAHPDHIGALPLLAKETGAEVIAHELEAPVIRGEREIPRSDPAKLQGLQKLFRPPKTTPKPSPVHRTVVEGDLIDGPLGSLQVLHTPGHAPGHICFWQAEKRVLITGDVVMHFRGIRTLPRGLFVDYEQNKAAIRRIAELPIEVACFGHGEPIIHDAATPIRAYAATIGS